MAFGIEPLVAYLMAKENEIKIVRIIMVGKINNISNEIIRERLREAYV
ncbi:MAG: V/A-type H+/Na+-transporting ATPase subunit [Clostridiales bacterium]|nr:V/A-type H+/Na+-transporting ATPase subunit [Clostridiales bacterium]